MKPVLFGDFSKGIGTSEFDQGGFPTLVGIDIHSTPGLATCSKAMEKTSATTVSKLCSCRVTLPNGDTLFGDSDGNIFKVTSVGVVSKVHTDSQGAVLGIDYLGSYVYYATASKLGRQGLSNASSEATWSSHNDTFGTFTNSSTYKPMKKCRLSLFIGDGKYVASVDDSGTFSANVLDLEPNQVITALGVANKDYLLIGTISGSAGDKSGLFLWDTFSPTWNDFDEIAEPGINCFIDGDEILFISAGTVGNIYYWSGASAIFFTKLKDGENSVTTSINHYASANLNGLPLLATARGIYSLGRASAKLPIAQVIEYVPSQGQGTTIGALAVSGSQVFASYQNGSNYGIDKLSTNKYSGKIITPVALGKASYLKVFYSSLPTGTSISARIKNDGGSWATHTLTKDANKMSYRSSKIIANKVFTQAEITLNASTTYAPSIFLIQAE